MMYRRDNRNRSLDDFGESRQKASPRPGRKPERAQRVDAPPALSSAPNLSAVPVK